MQKAKVALQLDISLMQKATTLQLHMMLLMQKASRLLHQEMSHMLKVVIQMLLAWLLILKVMVQLHRIIMSMLREHTISQMQAISFLVRQ